MSLTSVLLLALLRCVVAMVPFPLCLLWLLACFRGILPAFAPLHSLRLPALAPLPACATVFTLHFAYMRLLAYGSRYVFCLHTLLVCVYRAPCGCLRARLA